MMKLFVLVCILGLALSAPARRDSGDDDSSTGSDESAPLNRPLTEQDYESMTEDQYIELAQLLSQQANGELTADEQCVTNNEGLEFARMVMGDDTVSNIMANASSDDLSQLFDCMSEDDSQSFLDSLSALYELGQLLDGDLNTDFGNWTDTDYFAFLLELANQANGTDVDSDSCVTYGDIEAFFEYLFQDLSDAMDYDYGGDDSGQGEDNGDEEGEDSGDNKKKRDSGDDEGDYQDPDACLSAEDAQETLDFIGALMDICQQVPDDVPDIAEESRRRRKRRELA